MRTVGVAVGVLVLCVALAVGATVAEQRAAASVEQAVAVQEVARARQEEAVAAQERARAAQVAEQMRPAVIDASGEAQVELVNAEESWALLRSMALGYQRMAMQDAMDREWERRWRSIERVSLAVGVLAAALYFGPKGIEAAQQVRSAKED